MTPHRPPEGVNTIEQPGRCQAVLKHVWHWRCTRKAGPRGLCTQHNRFGASVPAMWIHWKNERGVVCCEPAGTWTKLSPRPEESR